MTHMMGLAGRRVALMAAVVSATVFAASLTADAEPWHCRHRRCHTTTTPSTTAPPSSTTSTTVQTTDVVVQPDGTGDSLRNALRSASPGTVIGVAAGTYPGSYISSLVGTPASPIVVQALGRVVLDGNGITADAVLRIDGADTIWRGFEVTNSDPNRTTTVPGSDPVGYQRHNGINVYGPRTRIEGGWVHDNHGNGIGLWAQSLGSTIDGTVVTRNGWRGPDRGHGHGIYTQNATDIKRIDNVMSLGNYGMGIQAYGAAGQVVGYRFDRLIVADNGVPAMLSPDDPVRSENLLVGAGETPADDIELTDSVFYQAVGSVSGGVRFGYSYPSNGRVKITGNLIAAGAQGLSVKGWSDATATGNTIYSTNTPTSSDRYLAHVRLPGVATWNYNTYYDQTGIEPYAYNGLQGPDGGGLLSWTSWRNMSGFDALSAYYRTTPPNRVVVNQQHVAVFNWERQPAVDLPPGRVLDPYTMTEVARVDGLVPTPSEFHAFVILPALTPVVSDDFNRTTLGTGWTVNLGSVGLVNGDMALAAGNIAIASWNTDPGTDQFAEARVSPGKPSNLLVQVFCRRRTTDMARYGFGYDDDPGDATTAPQWHIKYDGVPTASTRLLATSTTAPPLATGDVLRLECTGSNPVLLKGYHNGTLVLTATDSSPSRILSGRSGLVFRKWVSGAVTYPARAFTEFTAGGF